MEFFKCDIYKNLIQKFTTLMSQIWLRLQVVEIGEIWSNSLKQGSY